MLRLFSSIRKSLINEGKTSRYVRYAVGEVLLIMVGILLALQVQTWNEGRKDDKRKSTLIENLKHDCGINLQRLEAGIETADYINKELIKFLEVAAGDTSAYSLEELKTMATYLFSGITFTPAMGTYQMALSTGDIGLLGSPELNELYVKFDHSSRRFEEHRDLAGEMVYLGSTWKVRESLGSIHGLINRPYFTPEAFQLSDQEFREFIAQKHVYAAYENYQWIMRNSHKWLIQLKEDAQQILTALEALD